MEHMNGSCGWRYAQQIGRERRERVSHFDLSGEALLNSRHPNSTIRRQGDGVTSQWRQEALGLDLDVELK
jgi:hypothetical protein